MSTPRFQTRSHVRATALTAHVALFSAILAASAAHAEPRAASAVRLSKDGKPFASRSAAVADALSALPEGEAENPFDEGTEDAPLTDEEYQLMAAHAATSRARLADALDEARGKNISQRLEVLKSATIETVIQSVNGKHGQSELLMRMALSQGLAIAVGVPTADGKGIKRKAVLAQADDGLRGDILADSIRLALDYYQEEREFLARGKVTELPFARFSADRLHRARKWTLKTLSSADQYDLTVAILRQWRATANHYQNNDRLEIDKPLSEIQKTLAKLPKAPAYPQDLDAKTRGLAKRLHWLDDTMCAKYPCPDLPSGQDG